MAMVSRNPGGSGSPRLPADTVVVLGASNVARGVVDIVETSHGFHGDPVHMILAPGHGRSYGERSHVLWRTLPGLTQCALWSELAASGERSPEGRRTAVLTDVGNDLLYGRTVDQLLDWVEDCAGRLSDLGFRLVIVELPLGSVRRLGRARFLAARTLLFPGSPLRYDGLVSTCERLNHGLHTLAERFDAVIQPMNPDWYGVDPIHIRTSLQRQAWAQLLAPLKRDPSFTATRFTARDRRRLRAARHAMREWFGRVEHRLQPSVVFDDGSAVSLY